MVWLFVFIVIYPCICFIFGLHAEGSLRRSRGSLRRFKGSIRMFSWSSWRLEGVHVVPVSMSRFYGSSCKALKAPVCFRRHEMKIEKNRMMNTLSSMIDLSTSDSSSWLYLAQIYYGWLHHWWAAQPARLNVTKDLWPLTLNCKLSHQHYCYIETTKRNRVFCFFVVLSVSIGVVYVYTIYPKPFLESPDTMVDW